MAVSHLFPGLRLDIHGSLTKFFGKPPINQSHYYTLRYAPDEAFVPLGGSRFNTDHDNASTHPPVQAHFSVHWGGGHPPNNSLGWFYQTRQALKRVSGHRRRSRFSAGTLLRVSGFITPGSRYEKCYITIQNSPRQIKNRFVAFVHA